MNLDSCLIFEAYKSAKVSPLKIGDSVKINWFSKKEDKAKEVTAKITNLKPITATVLNGNKVPFELKKDGYYYQIIPGVKQVTKYSLTKFDPNYINFPEQNYNTSWRKQVNQWYQTIIKPIVRDLMKADWQIGPGGYIGNYIWTKFLPRDSNSDFKKMVFYYTRGDKEKNYPTVEVNVYLNETQTPEAKAKMMLAGSFLGPVLGSMPDGNAYGDKNAATFKEHVISAVNVATKKALETKEKINPTGEKSFSESVESHLTRYAFLIRKGQIEIHPVKYSSFGGETYVNKSVHKFFRFKKDACFATPGEAQKAAEAYLTKKANPTPLEERVPQSDLEKRILDRKKSIHYN